MQMKMNVSVNRRMLDIYSKIRFLFKKVIGNLNCFFFIKHSLI
jgi:hypothetical protein